MPTQTHPSDPVADRLLFGPFACATMNDKRYEFYDGLWREVISEDEFGPRRYEEEPS